MPPLRAPLQGSSFSLDVSGIAGFFGGEEAFAAMSSIHLVRGRRWLGWYNSPGSYFIAKKYGVLARSRVWDGLYPGVNVDPTIMLELDGKDGPSYTGVHSGTRMPKTGHLAYLLENYCSELKVDKNVGPEGGKSEAFLTIVKLEDFIEFKGYPDLPRERLSPFDPIAIIPITYSICAALLCAVFGDWYCFSMILLGVFCNGISCVVIGSGVLNLKHPNPSPNSPPGDGLLRGSGPRVILIKGPERIVSIMMRGRFNLRYASESAYHDIGFSSAALTMQFLLQLFLVPQGKLFGQIMFLSSLGVSWLFNAYLASVDREDLQKKLLMRALLQQPKFQTIGLPKWTTLAVYAAVMLNPPNIRGFLDNLIPNNTAVWAIVKEATANAVGTRKDPKQFLNENDDLLNLVNGLPNEKDKRLVNDLMEQASIAYTAASEFREEDMEVADDDSDMTGSEN